MTYACIKIMVLTLNTRLILIIIEANYFTYILNIEIWNITAIA